MIYHPLSLDLYEIWMASTYLETEMDEKASFEFFVRGPPRSRNFLVAAGHETLLNFLENFRLGPDEIDALIKLGFDKERMESLEGLRFMGDVEAVPEGTIVLHDEPIARFTAPIAEAQIIETAVINILHFQTLIASKAARMTLSAKGRGLVDFGLRRAHGDEAGLFAARSAHIAGFHATSNVRGGTTFGIPLSGTMAHSFVQAHDFEDEAFFNFSIHNPHSTILLIDTYDTLRGAENAARIARRLSKQGVPVRGVRLDSGDLLVLSKNVREILDRNQCENLRIVASGSLDEWEIRRLVDGGAPIDSFGVGTKLDVSSDRPYFDCAYKLVEYAGVPRFKLSSGKRLLPGPKQVFRRWDSDGKLDHDVLGTAEEHLDGEPLLRPIMRRGQRLSPPADLASIRSDVLSQLERIPEALKALEPIAANPLRISDALSNLAQQLEQTVSSKEAPSRLEDSAPMML